MVGQYQCKRSNCLSSDSARSPRAIMRSICKMGVGIIIVTERVGVLAVVQQPIIPVMVVESNAQGDWSYYSNVTGNGGVGGTSDGCYYAFGWSNC